MNRKRLVWFESPGDTEKEFHVFLIISSDLVQNVQRGKWCFKMTGIKYQQLESHSLLNCDSTNKNTRTNKKILVLYAVTKLMSKNSKNN